MDLGKSLSYQVSSLTNLIMIGVLQRIIKESIDMDVYWEVDSNLWVSVINSVHRVDGGSL